MCRLFFWLSEKFGCREKNYGTPGKIFGGPALSVALLVRFNNGFKAAAAEENLANNRTFQLRELALTFLKFCCDENGEAKEDVLGSPNLIDYALGNAQLLAKFVNNLKDKWGIGQSEQISYIVSISDY